MTKAGNDKEKKAARALAAEKGIKYTAALRIIREEKAARDAEKGQTQ